MARGRPARATVYARLDAAIVELRERLGGLPSPKESEFIWSGRMTTCLRNRSRCAGPGGADGA